MFTRYNHRTHQSLRSKTITKCFIRYFSDTTDGKINIIVYEPRFFNSLRYACACLCFFYVLVYATKTCVTPSDRVSRHRSFGEIKLLLLSRLHRVYIYKPTGSLAALLTVYGDQTERERGKTQFGPHRRGRFTSTRIIIVI